MKVSEERERGGYEKIIIIVIIVMIIKKKRERREKGESLRRETLFSSPVNTDKLKG